MCLSYSLFSQVPNSILKLNEDADIKFILVTDLDNDERKEILVIRDANDIISYTYENGEYVRQIYREVTNPLYMAYEDLNKDRETDILMIDENSGTLSILESETVNVTDQNTQLLTTYPNPAENLSFH